MLWCLFTSLNSSSSIKGLFPPPIKAPAFNPLSIPAIQGDYSMALIFFEILYLSSRVAFQLITRSTWKRRTEKRPSWNSSVGVNIPLNWKFRWIESSVEPKVPLKLRCMGLERLCFLFQHTILNSPADYFFFIEAYLRLKRWVNC